MLRRYGGVGIIRWGGYQVQVVGLRVNLLTTFTLDGVVQDTPSIIAPLTDGRLSNDSTVAASSELLYECLDA